MKKQLELALSLSSMCIIMAKWKNVMLI